jgi:hypothetical protein
VCNRLEEIWKAETTISIYELPYTSTFSIIEVVYVCINTLKVPIWSTGELLTKQFFDFIIDEAIIESVNSTSQILMIMINGIILRIDIPAQFEAPF